MVGHKHKWCEGCSPRLMEVRSLDEADDWFSNVHLFCQKCGFMCHVCAQDIASPGSDERRWAAFRTFQQLQARATPSDLTVANPVDEMAAFDGGGVRSSDAGKPRFDLLMVSDVCYDEQIITRAAKRMAEGAETYGDRNHEKMNTPDALARCKSSLLRHTIQYLAGETDEDHLAAIVCNVVMVSGIEKRVEGHS